MKTVEHWIGGASTPGSSDRTAEVYNPATGKVQARVLLAGTADVDQAVQTARKAYAAWQDVSLTRRARIMFAFRTVVDQDLYPCDFSKPKPIAARTYAYLNSHGLGAPDGGAA
jgi:malonate-semialdehyde dehydrogenase (acetylating)/methylmalonate-semialdehyde dehydrogenase